MITGYKKSMFANGISYNFDFRGPSFAVDTACASSLYALSLAVSDMRNGVCDSAIVGGSKLLLLPEHSLAFFRHGMLSSDGACKSFDSSGDGYVRYATFNQKRTIHLQLSLTMSFQFLFQS